LIFPHPIGIVIGSAAHIAKNVVVYQNVTIGGRSFNCNGPDDYPRIYENVVIYPGAVIAGGITVGANSIIGPNAIVTKDVPPNSLVVGINEIKLKAHRDAYTGS
jgi:serine O-acetyltransferase